MFDDLSSKKKYILIFIIVLLILVSFYFCFNLLKKTPANESTIFVETDNRPISEITADKIASTNRNGLNLDQAEKESIISGINKKVSKGGTIDIAKQREILDKINKNFQNSN